MTELLFILCASVLVAAQIYTQMTLAELVCGWTYHAAAAAVMCTALAGCYALTNPETVLAVLWVLVDKALG